MGRGGRDSIAIVLLAALALGALLSLAYAGWAFTARRGIFADFADGRSVSSGDATSNDRIDTTLLIVAGVVAGLALIWWLIRSLTDRVSAKGLNLAGIAVSIVGVIAVLVGLFLAGRVSDVDSQVAQGSQAMTATFVLGAGFVVLAIGLAIGAVVCWRVETADSTSD